MRGRLVAIVDHYRRPRVLGLDLLRIVASLTIILYHGDPMALFGRNEVGLIFHTDGYLAVDIFFVLSGWLLTRQALRMRGSFRTPLRLTLTFWARRWARTIPPYLVVLVVILVFGRQLAERDLVQPLSFGELLKHALFLQTVVPPNRFAVSWSLVTEEWFYLLLPLMILLAFTLRSRRLLLGLGVGALLLPTAIRSLLLLSSANSWDVLSQPVARYEGLVVGALLAAASLTLPWWETVMARRRWLFGIGCLVLAGLLVAGAGDSLWFRIFGLLAFSIFLGFLLPLLSQLHWPKSAPAQAVMGIAFLAELTYPLYLLHTLTKLHWSRAHGQTRLTYALLSIGILLLAATVLHLGIERPFLALRDKLAGPPGEGRKAWGRDIRRAPSGAAHMTAPQPVAD